MNTIFDLDLANLSPDAIKSFHSWDYVKNGKYIGMRKNTSDVHVDDITSESAYRYPLIWEKDGAFILDVQSDYYQADDDKHGYSINYFYRTTNVPVSHLKSIASGTHPSTFGYNLVRQY
jgi:hypothetical protein